MSLPLISAGIALAAAPAVQPSGASQTTWIGGALCLLLWIGYGWTLRQSGDKMRSRLRRMSRGRKVFLGSGGLILGLVFLIGGMALLAGLGGADANGIKWWAWPIILIFGGAFVHTQVLGAAALTTLMLEPPESSRPRAGSDEKEPNLAQSETAPASSASEPTEPAP